MSGGFFRGTSADQDTRFSNKHAKLMKSQKFASELEHLVDMSKVKMDVVKPWIATRVTEFLGFEDEVLINFIYGLLEGKVVNGKEVQIQLTGFMEKNTGKFMRELWTLLISAEKNATGVPQQFLDAKEEETRKKKAEADQIAIEIQRRKDKEAKEFEQEKLGKMDGADISKVTNAAVDPNSNITRRRDSSADPEDELEMDARNGLRGKNRVSKSFYSAGRSPRQREPSRSISKSHSNSRSLSDRSRSVSKSPQPRGRPAAYEKVHRSPRRRSITPHRRHSPGVSLSPSRRKSSHYMRRSRSPSYRRPISPVRRRIRSPLQHRSPSPARRRSPTFSSRSPVRRRFRSPVRRRSPSPASLSPVRRRSPYPVRRRSPSPVRRRSPSPVRRRSPSPVRRRSPSPVRRRSPSPVRRRSPSPVRRRSPSPVRRRSPSPVRRRSPSPVRRRSPSPVRRRLGRSPSTPRRGSPPLTRNRLPIAGRRRSPIPSRHRSPSPYKPSSLSPTGRRSPSPIGRKFPEDRRKSPLRSPMERIRGPVERRGGPTSVAVQPPSSFRSPQRDAKVHSDSRKKSPSWSPSPEKSQILSESPPGIRKRIVAKDRIPYESPMRQTSSPQKPKEDKIFSDRTEATGRKEGTKKFREDGDHKSSSQRRSPPSTVQHKEASEKFGSRQITEGRSSIVDLRKRNSELLSEKTSGKTVYPEVAEKHKSPQTNKRSILAEGPPLSHIGDKIKSDEKIRSKSNNTKGGGQVGGFDSVSEDSEKGKYDKEKRKHKRSDRHKKESDEDNSSDSQMEDRKEAKRRKKEERRVRKEEKRRRHEEKRQRRREERRIEKLKAKSKDNLTLPSDMGKNKEDNHASDGDNLTLPSDMGKNKEDNHASDGKHVTRMRSGSSDDEEDAYEKKRLEVELRKKALESLQAKKGIRR